MSIYHLHIPRTSGVYIKYNVLPGLIANNIPHFVSNRTHIDINLIKNSKFVGGHFGLMPIEYMDNPKVYTIFRDPVERFISYFNYTTGLIRIGEEAEKKKHDWLYGEQALVQANSQSKFITGSLNINNFNNNITNLQENVNNHWFLENYSLDLNNIYDNVNRFNCYTLDNLNSFIFDLNNELKNNFGFTSFKRNYKANSHRDINIFFSNKDKERIIELNSIDMEVYDYVQKNQKRY